MAWRRRDAVLALGLLLQCCASNLAFVLRAPRALSPRIVPRHLSARLTRLQSASEDDPQVLVEGTSALVLLLRLIQYIPAPMAFKTLPSSRIYVATSCALLAYHRVDAP